MLRLGRRPLGDATPLTHAPRRAAAAAARQVIERREEMDWRRHGVFCTFGLFYLVSSRRSSTAWQSAPLLIPRLQPRSAVPACIGAPAASQRSRCALCCCVPRATQGGFQYYLYNHLFVRWCAGMTAALGHKGSAPIKTFIDQAIQ